MIITPSIAVTHHSIRIPLLITSSLDYNVIAFSRSVSHKRVQSRYECNTWLSLLLSDSVAGIVDIELSADTFRNSEMV